jgi:hypothetical protein
LPCMVPREWIEPPDVDTAEGELLDEDDQHTDERSRMLRASSEEPRLLGSKDGRAHDRDGSPSESLDWDSEEERRRGGSGKGKGRVSRTMDEAGRTLPPSERVPTATGL